MHPHAAKADDEQPLYVSAKKVYPQAFQGPFRRAKWIILSVCLFAYYTLPFLRWNRGPNLPDQAVLIDFERRRFYFFFIELWPQEVYYFTGLLVIAAMVLFLMNAVAGRVWCGYLCPQTVWSDLYLQVEKLIEGDRRERIKRDVGPLTFEKVSLKALKHFCWIMIAWWTGGAWVLYFADAPTLVKQLATGTAPQIAYIWIGILTATTYIFAGHMREQVCLYMCPWPRIQAALTDEHALNVSYRYDRGEPRMSVKQAAKLSLVGGEAGDCIDCNQCVAACPTGVDIREGSQLGCIQCGLCIDACDSVMRKIGRPERLIAYDTEAAITARAAKTAPPRYRALRVRTLVYLAMIGLVGAVMLYTLANRSLVGLAVVHERTPLFVTLRDGSIRNAYTLRLANKRPDTVPFIVSVRGPDGLQIDLPDAQANGDGRSIIEVEPDATRETRLFVTVPRAAAGQKSQLIWIKVQDPATGEAVEVRDNFFAP
jgi:cytochrome c oxidase accessory protein FixG